MKVYVVNHYGESSNQNKRGLVKVPQLKIKNSKLQQSGFLIGCEYKIIYEFGRITLQLKDENHSKENNYDSGKKE